MSFKKNLPGLLSSHQVTQTKWEEQGGPSMWAGSLSFTLVQPQLSNNPGHIMAASCTAHPGTSSA